MMPRRTARPQEEEVRSRLSAAEEVVSGRDAGDADSRAEEERQIRAALAEYFSILQEWSRTKEEMATLENSR
jgi:hypothetical protein